jgi:arylsulfatase A-like enzyme
MSIADFLYGTDMTFEKSESYDELRFESIGSSLLEVLRSNGYETTGIGYPPLWRDDINDNKVWARNSGDKVFYWFDNYNLFMKKAREEINSKNNFFLYVCDLRSHVYFKDDVKWKELCTTDRYYRGYKLLDDTVGDIINILKENGKLENTLIIGFGDHGNEFYTHGFNNGCMHGTRPYIPLINTPMFIYDNSGKSTDNSVICTTDLKQLILNILKIEDCSDVHEHTPLSNCYMEHKKHVFSKNLFFRQKEKPTPAGYLGKGYSLVNEKYILMMTRAGFELYNHKVDYINMYNLLDIFSFDSKGGLVFKDEDYKTAHVHFKMFFTRYELEDMVKNYYEMLQLLLAELESRLRIIGYECDVDNLEESIRELVF